MTRYLLDTNIISYVFRERCPEALAVWFSAQRDENMFISALTVGEVWEGVLRLRQGRKREMLKSWLEGPGGLQSLFKGRVLDFNEGAAVIWANLMADGRAAGRTRPAVDTMIAAVAQANGCFVVTDNVKDFWGVSVINPLRS